jgi:large subunit ribosomal protein L6
MSRIGKHPVAIPAGVTVTVADGNVVTVKGAKATLTQQLSKDMIIKVEGNEVIVDRPSDEKEHRALHGLTRTLINNMVIGVSEGFSKSLTIIGTGYRAALSGKKLVLNLGHSHPIYFEESDLVSFEVPDANTILVKSYDKQVCGQIAAEIRSKRPPEPYHGKGVKYEGEHIRRKAGKAGK